VDALAQNATLIVIGAIVAIVLVAALLVISRARPPEARTIRVIGVGGGGSNAIEHMIEAKTAGVDFIVCNTDAQALRRSAAPRRLRIGDGVTRGLGAGGDPTLGKRAAEEDADAIALALEGSDMVFVTAGLGGGTGSGAGPIIAEIARKQGALTIGVVTKPFAFEGLRRRQVAEDAARELGGKVDALITIPNDRIGEVVQADVRFLDAFGTVDDVLRQGVQGIIDVVTSPGLINLDFADVRAVMEDAGPALIGLGRASGENRALDAARQAMSSPLLEANFEGAQSILFNIAGSSNVGLGEVTRAAEEIRAAADPEANVLFGASFDDDLGDELLVTLIAAGREGARKPVSELAGAAVAGVAASRTGATKTQVPRVATAAAPGAKRAQRRPPSGLPARDASVPSSELQEIGPQAGAEDDELDVPSFLRRRVGPRPEPREAAEARNGTS
jgi:cell division protein FtsZ